ncbi:MAG: spore coat protein U domain-containing protein [Hyphomicrobiales bacterium]|nr:spore coat U domain-containing protein [Hyphomicrobiales bacterium]MDE2018136.1 spore coat protein U domain-containing protein [Hyphomicrobiales bacterium]
MRKFLLAVAGCALCAAPASAATLSNTFNVLLTINAQCTLTKPADVNFGATGLISAALTQTTAISVTCTNATPYTLGLDAGLNGGGSVTARQMKGAAHAVLLPYKLTTDAAYSSNWGNSAATNWVSATGTGAAQSYTVYAEVPVPAATPAPDSYSDTITATLTY